MSPERFLLRARFRAWRRKWWKRGRREPQRWMTLEDRSAVELPGGDYAIALLTFNAQVEFGPLKVLPLK